jgi:hypothetical protein
VRTHAPVWSLNRVLVDAAAAPRGPSRDAAGVTRAASRSCSALWWQFHDAWQAATMACCMTSSSVGAGAELV